MIIYDDRIRELRAIGSANNLKVLNFIFVLGAVSNKDLAQAADMSDKTVADSLDTLAALGYIVKSNGQWRIAEGRQLVLGEALPFARLGNSESAALQALPPRPEIDIDLIGDAEPSTEMSELSTDPNESPSSRTLGLGISESPIAIDSSSNDSDINFEDPSTTTIYREQPARKISDSLSIECKVVLRALGVEGHNLDLIAVMSHVNPAYIAAKYAEYDELHERMAKAGKPDKAEFGLFIFWLKKNRAAQNKYLPPRLDLADLVRWCKDPATRKAFAYLDWEQR